MTNEHRRRHEYRLEPYEMKDLIADALLGITGSASDWAARKEPVPRIANTMKLAGKGLTAPVGLLMDIPDYVEAANSDRPGEELFVEAAGTVGGLVGGAGGTLLGGGLGTLLGGPVVGTAGGIAGGAVGSHWGSQASENAARGLINWYQDDSAPAYPEYPWTADNPPALLFGPSSSTSPNPYTRHDPELGFRTSSGYSGVNKGFDSPREMLRPASWPPVDPRVARVPTRLPRLPAS